uniref:HAT C-terminal dimerisation domain-containing protein n=1 Tax=Globisporangium ultimum (strain ATCC 200006 / CBS 805.95 / DAOM BR144) TaxID=431595 RepID=K3WGE8_GLOUD
MASLRQTCHTYSLTTDMWTDRAMRSFICLTMHFVDGDFHQHIWVLEVEGFQGKHDDGLSGFE